MNEKIKKLHKPGQFLQILIFKDDTEQDKIGVIYQEYDKKEIYDIIHLLVINGYTIKINFID